MWFLMGILATVMKSRLTLPGCARLSASQLATAPGATLFRDRPPRAGPAVAGATLFSCLGPVLGAARQQQHIRARQAKILLVTLLQALVPCREEPAVPPWACSGGRADSPLDAPWGALLPSTCEAPLLDPAPRGGGEAGSCCRAPLGAARVRARRLGRARAGRLALPPRLCPGRGGSPRCPCAGGTTTGLESRLVSLNFILFLITDILLGLIPNLNIRNTTNYLDAKAMVSVCTLSCFLTPKKHCLYETLEFHFRFSDSAC